MQKPGSDERIQRGQPIDDIEQLRNWRKNIPDLFHGKFRRQWDKAIAKKSMRAAVNAKCADCMNWQNKEIKQCDIITCPLWQYRPLQDKDSKREAAVRGYMAEIAKTTIEATQGKRKAQKGYIRSRSSDGRVISVE